MNLFSEFVGTTKEEWIAQVERDLKGTSYNDRFRRISLDGVSLQPLWDAGDRPDVASEPLKVIPGWRFREEIRETNFSRANVHIHRALARGANSVSILAYPVGPLVHNQSDMQSLLRGLWDSPPEIHWQCGPLSAQVVALYLSETRSRDLDPRTLRGGLDFDPLLDRCAAWVRDDIESWSEEATRRITEIREHLPEFTCLCIRGSLLEKAGASIAQELAWTLAILQEHLVNFRNGDLKELVAHTEVKLGIGTSFILEVAKVRALRLLLRELLALFGLDDVMPVIHCTSTSGNKTLFDPYNNLLRGTIESMAMVIGGADSITVAAYDQAYHAPDEFSEHLARNTHTLLGSEVHLDKVADPLAGSYVIESLTQAYAEKAWDILREIESKGGFVASWRAGDIEQELNRVREARALQVNKRQRVVVGTTAFGNPLETRLQDIDPKSPVVQVLPAQETLQDVVDSFVDAGQIDRWLSEFRVPSTPLDPFRVSWPFEHLRLRTERSKRTRPHIALVLFGDPKMRQARSAFCQNVMAAAGYTFEEVFVDQSDNLEVVADLYVLCSDDESYLPFLESRTTQRSYWIAGYPERREHLERAGAVGFLHARQALDETIQSLHVELGIEEYSPSGEGVAR